MNGFDIQVGQVRVQAEQNRGHSMEFWADRVADSICGISENAPDHVRQQAETYKNKIRDAVMWGLRGAVRSDRQTVAGALRENGLNVVADQIINYKLNGSN